MTSVARVPVHSLFETHLNPQDELLWAAVWLHEASREDGYLKYVADNADLLGGTGWGMDQFSWDNKYAGVQLKVTKVFLLPCMCLKPIAHFYI